MGKITREQVPEEETWDLSPIFENDTAWELSYKSVDQQIDLWLTTTFSFTNAKKLLNHLLEFDQFLEKLDRIAKYAMYKYSEDGTQSTNQKMSISAHLLLAKANNFKISFFQSLLAIDDHSLQKFFKEEPKLHQFSRFIERLNELKGNMLTKESEEVLAKLDYTFQSPESIFLAITSTDMTFRSVVDAKGETWPMSLHTYMTQVETSPDNVLRRNAYSSITEGLKKYQHGLSRVLANEINNNVHLAKLRGYSSTLDMLLQYSLPTISQLSTDIVTKDYFEKTIGTFRLGLAPHMQRYANLRKKQLGLKELKFSDVKAPLDQDFDPHIPYEQAADIIVESVGVLGKEYQDLMRRVFKERWVYLADNIGRRMIPFGSSVHRVHGYSFYPWYGNLFDVFLLGHELGHVIHYTLSDENQRIINNTHPQIFVEAPSTMVEHLIYYYLKKNCSDKRLQRWLDMYLMMSYHHNCVTHILEAEFLRRMYEIADKGDPLTTEVMKETKGAILKEFWGDTVIIDEGAKLTWMRQPHYYMGVFPFSYSIGMSASTVLAKKIHKKGTTLGEKWTEVLKQGASKTGYDLYKMIELDMTTMDKMEQTVDRVGAIVTELEKSF